MLQTVAARHSDSMKLELTANCICETGGSVHVDWGLSVRSISLLSSPIYKYIALLLTHAHGVTVNITWPVCTAQVALVHVEKLVRNSHPTWFRILRSVMWGDNVISPPQMTLFHKYWRLNMTFPDRLMGRERLFFAPVMCPGCGYWVQCFHYVDLHFFSLQINIISSAGWWTSVLTWNAVRGCAKMPHVLLLQLV